MSLSIGTDLVKIERINRAATRWGKRFLDRVFSGPEQAYCLQRPVPWPHLAARFAAKEAFFKAISTPGVSWRDVEVARDPAGRPSLQLENQARCLLGEREAAVSMSHDGEYAIATVVIYPASHLSDPS